MPFTLTNNALLVELAGGVLPRIGNDVGFCSIGRPAVEPVSPVFRKPVS